MMKKYHVGFTLIELVIVIVVLGVLAATALPRFVDVSTDARAAAVKGLAGGIRSTAAIARATQLVRGLQSNVSITMDGVVVLMQAGYPDAGNISTALTDTSGFTVTANAVNASFELRANCLALYRESTGLGYTVSAITSGC